MIRIFFAALLCLASPAFCAETMERPILHFRLVPAQPKVGEKIVIFSSLQSSFQNQEVLLDGSISGVPLRFEQSASEIFSASLNPYSGFPAGGGGFNFGGGGWGKVAIGAGGAAAIYATKSCSDQSIDTTIDKIIEYLKQNRGSSGSEGTNE